MSVCSGAITTTLEWQEKSKHSTNTAVIINRPGILYHSVRMYESINCWENRECKCMKEKSQELLN